MPSTEFRKPDASEYIPGVLQSVSNLCKQG